MTAPRVSVIVPAYNAADTLPACLGALQRQTVPRELYEIIVVDDSSNDRTAEVARGNGADQVLTIAHQGPAGARNAGVDVSGGQIVLFTDADCEPAEDWIERMTAPFNDPTVMGAKGVYRTRQRRWVARFVQLEYEDKYDRMRGLAAIDFVDTYSAAYRRDVFEQSGGFDPNFPRAAGEDIEFSYRLSRQGHRLVFVPGAVVFHRHPDTVWAYVRRKYYVGFWRVRMYRLHPGKAITDSHTPQTLKLQLGLLALFLGSLLLVAFRPGLWAVGVALLSAFVLSAIPFVVKAMRNDAAMASVSLGLLLLRAGALGLGFAIGILWHLLPVSRRSSAVES
jgi:cellulose synthase/poly-beta-1,6-N-acetylglucosamine synthase-like glycosyltransferase